MADSGVVDSGAVDSSSSLRLLLRAVPDYMYLCLAPIFYLIPVLISL